MIGTDGDDDVFVAVVAVAADGAAAAAVAADGAAAAADLHPTRYKMLYFAATVAFFLHLST
jgi:hypothetical protein